jgi:hypothetical protein
MSYEYFYTREIMPSTGSWDINNRERLDQYGAQILLYSEVKSALPDNPFKLFCHNSEVKFDFNNELTQEQHDLLTTTVNNHKNNT